MIDDDELARRMRTAFDGAVPSPFAPQRAAANAFTAAPRPAAFIDTFVAFFWKPAALLAIPTLIAAAAAPLVLQKSETESAVVAFFDGTASTNATEGDLSALMLGSTQ